MEITKGLQEELDKISEVAGYLWAKGWCERNAGNISLNITRFKSELKLQAEQYPAIEKEMPKEAAGMLIFVTGTGKFLRDLVSKIDEAACIISIDEDAKSYRIVWGGKGDKAFRPTSEFVSHLALHLINQKENNGNHCIVHTHPIELIALSHHPEIGKNEEKLNQILWSMIPEVRVFVPKGISIAPYVLPGSEALAQLNAKGLVSRNVVLWSLHGALAAGKDAIEAFDYIDVANKGAIIYLKCLSAGYTPVGLSDEQMQELEDNFLK